MSASVSFQQVEIGVRSPDGWAVWCIYGREYAIDHYGIEKEDFGKFVHHCGDSISIEKGVGRIEARDPGQWPTSRMKIIAKTLGLARITVTAKAAN